MRLLILFILLSLGAEASNAQIIRANAQYKPNIIDTLLLDLYPNADAAYSLRKLRTSYNGNAIRIRRDSTGNAEIDIGFLPSGNLDTNAIKNHCRNNSCRVTTWYDQSGNNQNASNATAAQQPRIVNAGAIERQNGEVAIRFLGAQRLQATRFAAPSINFNYIFVASVTNISSNNYSLGCDGGAFNVSGIYENGNQFGAYLLVNRTGANTGNNGSFSISNNTQYFVSEQYLSTDSAINYVNNNVGAKISMLMSGNKFTAGTFNWNIGSYNNTNGTLNSTFSLNGSIQEHIIYKLDQTNNISGIKTNINNYYGIW